MPIAEDIIKTLPKLEPKSKGPKVPPQLIIIGGGPAGLTAGIYAARAGINTLLIEKALPGGQASTTELIENFPGFPDGIRGVELGGRMERQAKKWGLEISWGNVSRLALENEKKIVEVDKKTYRVPTIIIASGAEQKKLRVLGEEKFLGRGVSYCAICDGPFYKDKNIVVAGGGNAAIEEALYLTRFAQSVTIIHRRKNLRADKILQEQALAESKINFLLDTIVEEIHGEKILNAITVKNVTSGKKEKININGIFIYIGVTPNSQFAKDIVKTDGDGFIIADEEMKTNVAGIFAAGDVRIKSLRQVITATADGAIAANSVRQYLEKPKK